MPWILYRYILKDLLKLLLTTTGVLVLVLGVAAAIKPLSDGLLGPLSLIKFITYMIPPMLNLALPFAGAFAGTLVFNRMAADNEILVLRASGVNYLIILLPVAMLGLALTVGMFLLSNWVIPKCFSLAERTLEKDIVSLVVRQVQKGEPIREKNLVVYADAAAEGEPDPAEPGSEIEPQRLVALRGVAVGRLDTQGRLTSEGTADRADMLLYRAGGESWVMLRLKNARYYGEDQGSRGVTEDLPLGPYPVANPFRERTGYMSLSQLQGLKQHPENHEDLRRVRRDLVMAISREQVIRLMEQYLSPGQGGKLTLVSQVGNEKYVLRAPLVRRHATGLELSASDTAKVEVERLAHDLLPDRRFRAARAVLHVDAEQSDEPRVDIRLYDLEVINPWDETRVTQRPAQLLQVMRWPQEVSRPLRMRPLRGLIDDADAGFVEVVEIQALATKATQDISRLLRRTLIELHERAALAGVCLLTILLGCILSMKLQGRTPLVVYFWTFILAAIAVILIRSGEQFFDKEGRNFMVAVAMIWSGVALTAAAILTTYWKLEKN